MLTIQENILTKSKTIRGYAGFKASQTSLSLFSKDKFEFCGFLVVDKDKTDKVSGDLRKFYNVWNEADKLPF